MTNKQISTTCIAVLIVLGVTMRFLPHLPNMTPITALALFSAVYGKRWYAFVIPVVAMVASDAVIGFHSLVWATWGSFALIGLIGLWVRRQTTLRRVLLGAITGSTLFYVITNWAVWAFTPLYSKDIAGLGQSYSAALPFFRNMALGDLFYVGVLFGLAEGVAWIVRRRAVSFAYNHNHDHNRN